MRPALPSVPPRGRALALVVAAAVVAAGLVSGAAPARAEDPTTWQVASPDGSVVAGVQLVDGMMSMTTTKAGRTLVTAERLGVSTSAGDISSGLSVVSSSTRTVQGGYSTLTGKRTTRVVDQRELVLDVTAASGRTMELVVRAADDGVAYRYVVAGSGAWSVTGEPVAFTVPGDAAAWMQSYVPWYENDYVTATGATAPTGDVGFPAVFRSGATFTMLTESNVRGTYAGSHLTHPTAGTPTYGLGLFQGDPVRADGDLTTPWRVELVGTAAQLVGSTLVDDLADSSELVDTSWIHPGISAWSWLAAGASIGAQGDLATQERFVDLAAREGWRYALVDEGWNADWMPTLVQYANDRGVAVNAWFNSNQLWTDEQQTSWFEKLRAWGVTGVKVDFISSDSQDTFAWYDRIAARAAAYHLVVDFHGATIPRGLQRTWPNVMTYEAVHGEEGGRDPEQNTILPFTRNVLGSMDYTPTVFTGNSQTTKAHELAETVVFESGLQHPADGPDAYAAQPVAASFLAQVPATWDDTRFVSGDPGDAAVVARRSGPDWFVGGIADGATTLTVPLDMLGDGSWLVDRVSDDGSDLTRTTTTETSASVLTIPVAEHGGFALEACPATAGRTTCAEPVPAATIAPTTVTADRSTVRSGDVVTVDGTFTVDANGPATNVAMDVVLPPSWTLVSGGVVESGSVVENGTLHGAWQVRVGSGGPRGDVSIPVSTDFSTPAGRARTSSGVTTVSVATDPPSGDVYLSDLEFQTASTDYGTVQRDHDLRGDAIALGGTTYPKGVVANANATIGVYLGGACSSFTATVGVTADGDTPSEGSVTFQAFDGDGNALGAAVGSADSPVTMASGGTPFTVRTDGVQQLVLRVGDAGNGIGNDHGAFADAVVHCA